MQRTCCAGGAPRNWSATGCSEQRLSCKQAAPQHGCADCAVQSAWRGNRPYIRTQQLQQTPPAVAVLLCAPAVTSPCVFSQEEGTVDLCSCDTTYRCCLRPNHQTTAALLFPPQESIWSVDLWLKAQLDTSDVHQQDVPTRAWPQLLH